MNKAEQWLVPTNSHEISPQTETPSTWERIFSEEIPFRLPSGSFWVESLFFCIHPQYSVSTVGVWRQNTPRISVFGSEDIPALFLVFRPHPPLSLSDEEISWSNTIPVTWLVWQRSYLKQGSGLKGALGKLNLITKWAVIPFAAITLCCSICHSDQGSDANTSEKWPHCVLLHANQTTNMEAFNGAFSASSKTQWFSLHDRCLTQPVSISCFLTVKWAVICEWGSD